MKVQNMLAAALLMAAACGGSDTNDVEPRLIAGGGLGDGAIGGEVNIHVIDGVTDAPIASANIYVGEPGETPMEGLTNSAGLFVLEDESLDGATTITVTAPGYSTSTWFGANAANLTIPLNPTGSSTIPQAELAGTITGWEALPAPAMNHLLIAVVSYSQSPLLGDAANNLPPPAIGGQVPANVCIKTAQISQCAWRINSRTGDVAAYAIIIDVDTKGNMDDSDDTSTVVGFAFKDALTVNDGVDQSGIALEQLAVGALTDVGVTLATSPSGLTENTVLFQLDLGASGLLNVGAAGGDDIGTHTLPKLEGPFASGKYRALAITDDGAEREDNPGTIILKQLSGLPSTVDMGEWMPLATGLTAEAGNYSYTPVSESSLHIVNFRSSNGNEVWSTVLLDDRTSFTLPGISPSPLPSGELTMSVLQWEGDIDLSDFEIDTLLDVITRFSTAQITFTN